MKPVPQKRVCMVMTVIIQKKKKKKEREKEDPKSKTIRQELRSIPIPDTNDQIETPLFDSDYKFLFRFQVAL